MAIRTSSKVYSITYVFVKKPLQAYLCIFVDSHELFMNSSKKLKSFAFLSKTSAFNARWKKYNKSSKLNRLYFINIHNQYKHN